MSFELPSGLPEGPWNAVRVSAGKWNHEVRDKNGEVVIIFAGEELARAIASIPNMVEEIGRLRALNAEMRHFVSDVADMDEMACERARIIARAILGKSQGAS